MAKGWSGANTALKYIRALYVSGNR